MGFRSKLIKPYAKKVSKKIKKWSAKPIEAQQSIFKKLIKEGKKTAFGKDHNFNNIKSYKDFKANVPIQDYEGMRHYVDRIIDGEADVLWKGFPIYFAKTSGTTSGVKYIPITKDSLPNHFETARNALFHYYIENGKGKWLDGKMIFLSGSPELTKTGGIKTGRLSGIVNHQVPSWLKLNQLPSYKTNCIEAWEEKVEKIVKETVKQDLRLISGIPPWVQMYFERLLEVSGKENIKELFPNFDVFVYGGVNYEPYRNSLEKLIGEEIDTIETYPASEGFIAFQDSQKEPGLLLNVASGIFFEFIPAEEIFEENPTRYRLEEVKLGINYAIIINSNAGLWGYNIGDTVEFVSLSPYRLIVTGRIKHFISAFGEHVIGKEVENAMLEVAKEENIRVVEFSVAPQINPSEKSLPYHEWFIEFEDMPEDMNRFATKIDKKMVEQNIYYEDLISGGILKTLQITPLRKNAFRDYMKSIGKLGGQNKVPRLSNDRKLADQLQAYLLPKVDQ
ncbi:MAG: GH3 auxin-responsive promoter family protein [Saprospiraceae bacterium]